ncbi:ABC transporter ATP-binding protein [Kiloniella sp. EL199]|uniref:ABC transporter ATP-binding protein n=1 Tax=Kiloniella sp. EL199 TaxID=2107581 RepID=UPI000EA0B8A6|nr:ABC transporter ATP-binding protein [Kiloniella sp. EL199]
MANIRLSNISKRFGNTDVLDGIDLDINDKEFVTLVGPSGCGKSTLLRIIAGLESADTGTVSINDTDVTGIRPANRNLSMVFQSYALYPHLSVAQNMLTPLKLRDLSFLQRLPMIGPLLAKTEYQTLYQQVKKTAQILKIENLLERKPGQLSGGQRQRAALGRAMVRDPLAFLMDEPLSNLDAALRVHMRSELTQLHQRLKTTFVYVTHDQSEALTMSDKMAVMMKGKILQYGPPDEIYHNPQTTDVARFVGSPAINIIPGSTDETGCVSLLGRSLGIYISSPRTSIQIGLRPEHLSLSEDSSNSFPGIIRHIENLGSDLFYHLEVEGMRQRIVVRTSQSEGRRLPLGSLTCFTAEKDKHLVFDENGNRLTTKSQKLAEVA